MKGQQRSDLLHSSLGDNITCMDVLKLLSQAVNCRLCWAGGLCWASRSPEGLPSGSHSSLMVASWALGPQKSCVQVGNCRRHLLGAARSPCLVPGALEASSSDSNHTRDWVRVLDPSTSGLWGQLCSVYQRGFQGTTSPMRHSEKRTSEVNLV